MPTPGNPDHREMVPTGCGNLEGPARLRLAAYVGEVGGRSDVNRVIVSSALRWCLPLQHAHQVGQIAHAADVDTRHERGLAHARGGHKQARVTALDSQRGCDGSRDRVNPTVES